MLRSRESRREESLDVHVADPMMSSAEGIDPEHEALLADSVGLGLLVVFNTLNSLRATRLRAIRPLRRTFRRDRSHRGTLYNCNKTTR